MSLLDTSEVKDYHYAWHIDKQYMSNFKYKLQYVKQFLGKPSNNTDLCLAVFLTYFTSPYWMSIGCDDILTNMPFICENRFYTVQPYSYIRGNVTCPEHSIYVTEFCWSVRKVVKGKIVVRSISYSLKLLLSSWSLGDAMRSHISIIGSSGKCLRTDSLSRQRIKRWLLVDECESNDYTLIGHNYLTYTYICHGKYIDSWLILFCCLALNPIQSGVFKCDKRL